MPQQCSRDDAAADFHRSEFGRIGDRDQERNSYAKNRKPFAPNLYVSRDLLWFVSLQGMTRFSQSGFSLIPPGTKRPGQFIKSRFARNFQNVHAS